MDAIRGKDIRVDLDNIDYIPKLLKQLDSTKLTLLITKGGVVQNITNNTFILYFKKGDGTTVTQTEGFDTSQGAQGILKIELDIDCVRASGTGSFEIHILKDGNKISSFQVECTISATIMDGVPSSNKVTLIEQLENTILEGIDTRDELQEVIETADLTTYASRQDVNELNAHLEETTNILGLKLSKAQIQTLIGFADINKNLSQIDATMLAPTLLQQIAGTAGVNVTPLDLSVLRRHIADLAVTPSKTSFITISSNLFNSNTEIVGYNISSSTGLLVSNASYNSSDFIDIKPSTSYSYLGFINVAYYDMNKQFISRPSLTYAGQTLLSPTNAYYARVHYQISSAYQRQMNEGTTLLSYETFYQKFNGINLQENSVKIENIKDYSVTNSKLALQSVNKDNIVNKSVTTKKTNFIVQNSNMFNHKTITKGYVILSNGSITENTLYSISDFIDIKPSTNYSTYGFLNISYYNANKEFISRSTFTSSAAEQNFTSPSNAYYARLNFQGDVLASNRQMNENISLLPYEAYKEVLEGISFSKESMDEIIEFIKQDDDILKANKTDSVIFDMSINNIFDTNETYSQYGDFTNTTSAQVYQMYDNLMAQYPDYITKEVLGNDLYGNSISLYKFTPSKPSAGVGTKYPKVFLTSGTHGYEHVPGLITFLMFKDICEKWADYPLLEALRFNVDFLVIPVVNPSGWDDYTRTNRNGVDINRNFSEQWVQGTVGTVTYGGANPLSEVEAQYVKSVFDNNPDIDIMYDFHNFSGSATTDYFIWIPTNAGSYVQHMAQTLISRMTRKWRKEYTFLPSNHDYFVGYADGTTGGMIHNHAFGRGIKFTATFEVCGRWWLEPNTTPYNTTHKVTAVEALVNWLLINLHELTK